MRERRERNDELWLRSEGRRSVAVDVDVEGPADDDEAIVVVVCRETLW